MHEKTINFLRVYIIGAVKVSMKVCAVESWLLINLISIFCLSIKPSRTYNSLSSIKLHQHDFYNCSPTS